MAQVKIILTEDVYNLGNAGDLVSVKPGYARNFLLPTGKAEIATEARVNELEHQRRVIAERVAKQLKDLNQTRLALQKLELSTEAQVGEEGKLFGSVTAANIAQLIADQGFEIDRRKIELSEPIKTAGTHEVPIKLHREVIANVKVQVLAVGGAPTEDEADAAADDRDETPVRDEDDEE